MLRDQLVADLEERRGEGQARLVRARAGGAARGALHQRHHRLHALALPGAARDVDIVGAAGFQGQADVFTAPLDFGPVIEFVAHALSLRYRWVYRWRRL